MGHRGHGAARQYLVRWKGAGAHEDEWFTRASLVAGGHGAGRASLVRTFPTNRVFAYLRNARWRGPPKAQGGRAQVVWGDAWGYRSKVR